MKMKPRCVPCILNRVVYESELVIKEQKKLEEVMKKVVKKISELYGSSLSSAEIATQIHGLTYELIGNRDPYKELKERSNEIALKLLPKAEKFIENSKNKIEAAMLVSIAGNSIDFGIAGSAASPEELERKFDDLIKQGLYHNDFKKMEKYLKGNVVYFTDNCGEIVFDKLVCRELKKIANHVTIVPKKYPILTDATYQDVKKLGFDEVVDEIITTGGFAVGVDFKSMPEKLKSRIGEADIIISKGMANYEAFSEANYRPMAYLLRVKCKSIAEDMGLPVNVNAIKLYES
ncbi:MAG: DUF89 family protein [Thermoplasmata archaeon]|nr:MAG: DUF89 family protein [Thermoplasmata archaeon]